LPSPAWFLVHERWVHSYPNEWVTTLLTICRSVKYYCFIYGTNCFRTGGTRWWWTRKSSQWKWQEGFVKFYFVLVYNIYQWLSLCLCLL
jgi:hypothetical protein